MALAVTPIPTHRRSRPLRLIPRSPRPLAPRQIVQATANGEERVAVLPAAVCDRYCWLQVRAIHGDADVTTEALLDGRQVRELVRMRGRAACFLDDRPRPSRFSRRAVRRGEQAFRADEPAWLGEQDGLGMPEDF